MTHDARVVAAQLAECAKGDVEDLVDPRAAHDALIKLAGKAAVARYALEAVDDDKTEMTIPLTHGLIAILEEIGDTAWNVARIQFGKEWNSRFDPAG